MVLVRQSIMNVKLSKRCTNSNLKVKIGDNIYYTIPQVTQFKYLRSIIQNDREIERDANRRIQAK